MAVQRCVQCTIVETAIAQPAPIRMADAAPLWGVRDSGPYLHDGGAETIQDAIAMHGGERSRRRTNISNCRTINRQQLVVPEIADRPRRPPRDLTSRR